MGDTRTIFVGGIPPKADENSLKGFFQSFGQVDNVKIIYDRNTGKSKGYGFVTFSDNTTADQVQKQPNLYFLGKTMNVGPAYRKTENEPKAVSNPFNSFVPQYNATQQPLGYNPYMMPGYQNYPTTYANPAGNMAYIQPPYSPLYLSPQQLQQLQMQQLQSMQGAQNSVAGTPNSSQPQ
eukprot:TRINITY_DN11479_c0_g1_i1.p1 TRINITY_DN11479_c0_g1~~TRINITY_DN11479_c0_g1_i1.p1  ORF type:complete len:179 (+),score=36.39 TRINITY_DN11479_c0_g1_i1:116-652(+)